MPELTRANGITIFLMGIALILFKIGTSLNRFTLGLDPFEHPLRDVSTYMLGCVAGILGIIFVVPISYHIRRWWIGGCLLALLAAILARIYFGV